MAEAEKSFGCQSQEGSTYFKKKEKRTLETFSGKLTTYPNPKFTYRSSISRVQKVQEAVPTKKKEKRTLETFSEKPTIHPSPNSLTISNVPLPIFRSGVQEAVPTKKNVRNVFRETHPIHLPP